MAPACRHCGQLHEAHLTMCPITGARLGSAAYTMVNEDETLVGNVVAERYHVRDILGQGSTGTVFGTVHVHFDRGAAMKVLRPRYTTLDTVHRLFQTDARAAFSVVHPSLCEVFDIGTLPDGAPFFVTELLDGDTLASRLGRERFSTAAAVDLMMQLLSAMEAVHARDLLLRDLRPQNIFLAQRRGCRPVVKILDFGLSRLIPLEKVAREWDALRAAVGAGDLSGSLSLPYYLSPERTRGEQGLEPSSDIFIASMIFYEALTGQRPFNASSWNALTALIAQAQPTHLSVLRPDVPQELGALVMRALSSKPRSRPGTAREMQDELRAAFEGAKRGSASMRAIPVSPMTEPEPSAHTPPSTDREQSDKRPAYGKLPPLASVPVPVPPVAARPAEVVPHSRRETDKPARLDQGLDGLYEDVTSTDRKQIDLALARLEPTIDEASADHPIRTVRPPPAVDPEIDVDVDMSDVAAPATSRGDDFAELLGLSSKKRRTDGEEETATMQLTPEVRARIEQMTRTISDHASVEDSNRPPPTRRLTKPPR